MKVEESQKIKAADMYIKKFNLKVFEFLNLLVINVEMQYSDSLTQNTF